MKKLINTCWFWPTAIIVFAGIITPILYHYTYHYTDKVFWFREEGMYSKVSVVILFAAISMKLVVRLIRFTNRIKKYKY